MTILPQNPDLDDDTPIWGAEAIGRIIGKSKVATFHLLETQQIPGRKLGRRWFVTRRQLRDFFAGQAAG